MIKADASVTIRWFGIDLVWNLLELEVMRYMDFLEGNYYRTYHKFQPIGFNMQILII